MKDKSWEGVGWVVITMLSGTVAAANSHPVPKLIALLIAIGAGTKAIDCFQTSATAAYQQLAVSKGCRQLALRNSY